MMSKSIFPGFGFFGKMRKGVLDLTIQQAVLIIFLVLAVLVFLVIIGLSLGSSKGIATNFKGLFGLIGM